jgi:hypothetical protein
MRTWSAYKVQAFRKLTSLQAQITITFWRICDIKAKDKWPLPSEGERQNADSGKVYYTPDFTSDMQDPTNINKTSTKT